MYQLIHVHVNNKKLYQQNISKCRKLEYKWQGQVKGCLLISMVYSGVHVYSKQTKRNKFKTVWASTRRWIIVSLTA